MSVWARDDKAHLFCFSKFGFDDLITVASHGREGVTRDCFAIGLIVENRRLEFRAVAQTNDKLARAARAESAFNERGASAFDEGGLFVEIYGGETYRNRIRAVIVRSLVRVLCHSLNVASNASEVYNNFPHM